MSVFISSPPKFFLMGYSSFLLRFYNIPFHPCFVVGGKVELSSVLFFQRCFLAPFPSVIAGWGEGMGDKGEGMGEKRWGGEEVGDINGK